MEPICVLNHVFALRGYMKECILGNLRRRFLYVLKTNNGLQRPTVSESLIKRHISIVHLAEQHIIMDITQNIQEVLHSEAFSGLVSSLHLIEKPTDQHTGSATDSICNWYIENIIKDISESVTNLRELQAFIHIFGGCGVDRLDKNTKITQLHFLNCIDTSLRSNRDVLKTVATSMHANDRIEGEASMRPIIYLETVIDLCAQTGLALAFDRLLVEASSAILEESAPLLHSLLAGMVKHLPDGISEKEGIKRMRTMANTVLSMVMIQFG